jgi:U3 small nucleolar RNA-associated protein 7
MWAPNVPEAVVSLQCHLGPVRALAVDASGRYMATAGTDRQVHIWDLRNSFQRLHSYFSHSTPVALDISQQGFMAVGFGSQVRLRFPLFTRIQAVHARLHRFGS